MPMTNPATVAVLGVPFHNVSMDETVAYVDEKIRSRSFHQIATANLDFLVHAIRDPEMQEILCTCDLVIPDGMPVLWGARLLGSSLKQRVCGVDLVPRLAELCARENYSMFFLGASEQNSQRAAENLKKRFPGLRIAGRYSPPVAPLEQMNHEEILRRIDRARPDILLVAMGNPKQEKWLAMHRHRLNVPVCIGVGGSIDFIAGSVKRAPRWMQVAGLEWAYRMLQEPGRLAHRYFGDAMGFARYMPQQYMAMAMQPRHRTRAGIFADQSGNTSVISIYGDLSGETLEEFRVAAEDAVNCGMNLVLNLSQTHYVGPEALGTLISIGAGLRSHGSQFWLAEMRPHVQRLINGSRLAGLFMTTSSVNDALQRTERAEQRQMNTAQPMMNGRPMESPVQVRVELLQDVCRKVNAANTPAPFAAPVEETGLAYQSSLS
ncbi:WecB/TagA/CpsF family glycosyltransferase [Silvibacterium sp.]|uniref:WecB/TagA/CpsF family glycosyltransferase n=1 Tax=Silvibacterium sp. TaxID=1964179 RepID=UPI0039E443C0